MHHAPALLQLVKYDLSTHHVLSELLTKLCAQSEQGRLILTNRRLVFCELQGSIYQKQEGNCTEHFIILTKQDLKAQVFILIHFYKHRCDKTFFLIRSCLIFSKIVTAFVDSEIYKKNR